MKKILVVCFFAILCFPLFGQEGGFTFGQVTYRELEMKVYEKDTSAVAVVLDEFGEAFMDDEDPYNLVFTVHRKIKILKPAGLEYANVQLYLDKFENRKELVRSIKASSFTFEKGSMKETPLEFRNIFTENFDRDTEVRKFAIPNVEVGSVIEYQYVLESPFKFNFRSWFFQWNIPKVKSEYWALIPGNYLYNITLKGFINLSLNENALVKDCYRPAGRSADCVRYKFGMKDIPAFVDEDYMTARSNFVAAINFELSEVRHFDGRVDKITKEWRDAEIELRRHSDFGVQLKRGSDDLQTLAMAEVAGQADPLVKAEKIFDITRGWYRWNEHLGMFAELGLKKAFEQRTGNVGDINLSMIAVMREADLDVEPVILSTVSNGLPTELHPVLSDFNYVVAKVNIGEKVYLADATDKFLPFGILPERCLNGKGRVLGEDGSYWHDLKPADRGKQLSIFTLKLGDDGTIKGKLQTSYVGYEAIIQRKRLFSFSSQEEYVTELRNNSHLMTLGDLELKNAEDIYEPFVQSLDVEMQAFDGAETENFLFNPFLSRKWTSNPFKSNQRLYPVDFIRPTEYTMILKLEYPENFEIANLPEKVGLALPGSGGRYVFEAVDQDHVLSLTSSLVINKTVFTSLEYHYLRELFSRMIQIQNGDLLFKKKT